MQASKGSEIVPVRSCAEEVSEVVTKGTALDVESAEDVTDKTWELSLLDSPSKSSVEGLFIYKNVFNLIPKSIRGFVGLKTLKFFGNEINLFPLETGELVGLECLQVKISSPKLSGLPLQKLKALKELELCKIPARPSSIPLLSEIANLTGLTKLAVCHFNIRYLPAEISCLTNLEDLDLSFNKLKHLPIEITFLSSLQTLKVANNKLEELPLDISRLQRLETLDVSNNKLTSLGSLNLYSMQNLRTLSLQYNKLRNCCQIPSWICCNLEGNGKDMSNDEFISDLIEVDDEATQEVEGRHLYNGPHCVSGVSSEVLSKNRSSAVRRRGKGWKRRDYLQQKAREERLNSIRKGRNDDHQMKVDVKCKDCKLPAVASESMSESSSIVESESGSAKDIARTVERVHVGEDDNFNLKCKKCKPPVDASESLSDSSSIVDNPPDLVKGLDDIGEDYHRLSVIQDEDDNIIVDSTGSNKESDCDHNGEPKEVSGSNFSKTGGEEELTEADNIIVDSIGSNKDCDCDHNSGPKEVSASNFSKAGGEDENSAPEVPNKSAFSKRHSDGFPDNPKPSKTRRPFDECLNLSFKYSTESYCSTKDRLPDGFYDAGRDRPFRSLQNYEHHVCLGSREVILVDRNRDEELDVIAKSANALLSSLKQPDGTVDNLQRASLLALLVSDWFGGIDRSNLVTMTRRSASGVNFIQKPFVCTCPTGNSENAEASSKRSTRFAENFNFTDLCEKSLQTIKQARNSSVVPIGALRWGVCRHRAVLMKYLCDRVDPPIPCELVRGYLDFMPHAWNTVLVSRDDSWVRMVVDACCPVDIREETDPEFFCRYIPLRRIDFSLTSEDDASSDSSPSISFSNEVKQVALSSLVRCKLGSVQAVAKVRSLDTCGATVDEIKSFEYNCLGEVRMLGALKKHPCIVDIYGHQIWSEWVQLADGNEKQRLLKSAIVMEYFEGGSLKSYLEKLSKSGESRVAVEWTLSIARDVACALAELHAKHIIHRDIKSENILIDVDRSAADGSTPLVKLCDFDRAVPLRSSLHTCCIAHVGIPPPDICVGTPRWMAPEVLRAMHIRNAYGLEVDIWSYGCLLLELLTLKIPYAGLSDSTVHDLLQMGRRPQLTEELEGLSSSDELEMEKSSLGIKAEGGIKAEEDTLKFLVNLFHMCTRRNPEKRPTASRIYQMLQAQTASFVRSEK
ncbi:hypothetical protein MKW94_010538 [Papaver nudicaule]|uniref:Protein kinase domain-containing protein n=1 Tax=Papaver nudicaule TaxID=74823 RepID=A0AA42AZ90_PAPNU|nr:hypothetical protein [Papaver nudicaule]